MAQSKLQRQELLLVKLKVHGQEIESMHGNVCSEGIRKIWRFADYRVGEFP